MNTFFVGNHPVGHYVANFSSPRLTGVPRMYIKEGRSPATTTSSLAASAPLTPEPSKTTETTPADPENQTQSLINGEKTFFMKARIMAGQADLSYSAESTSQGDAKDTAASPTGVERSDRKGAAADLGVDEIEDFRWLAKEEVEAVVHPEYWRGVRHMLVAQ
jgi:hypothetical protein